jgi:excisionase family DNA binding protein
MAHALKLLPPNGEEPIAPQSEAAKSAQTVTFGDLDRAIAALLALILDQQRDLVESQRDLAALRQTLNLPALPPPALDKCWVASKFAADKIGFSDESVRRWASFGKIEAKRCGGRWLVNLSDVERYVGAKKKVALVR